MDITTNDELNEISKDMNRKINLMKNTFKEIDKSLGVVNDSIDNNAYRLGYMVERKKRKMKIKNDML